MRKIMSILAGVWLALACEREASEHGAHGDGAAHEAGGDEHDEHDENEAEGEHAGERHAEESSLALHADDLTRFGVTLATAGPGSVDSGIELLGEVHPNGDRVAHIVPRYPGVVREVLKSVGDRVAAGDVLMRIESNEGLSIYATRARLAGTVIARDIAVGEAVDRDKQAFVIADLSSVWIDLAVYQKDLTAVRIGQRASISAGAEGPAAEGAISYVTPVVDEPTRTSVARVVLSNTNGAWRPGTFVTAHLIDPVAAEVTVPRSALHTLEGRAVVFAESNDGFEAREVRVGRQGEDRAEIVAGLESGVRVAAENSFLLKAELLEGSAEHQH